jgi:hypothetical protein
MSGHSYDRPISASVTETSSRRGVLRVVSALVLASVLSSLGLGQVAAACRVTGRRCKKNAQCCSSNCRGKRERKTCRGNAPSPTPACLVGERLCPEGICVPEKQCCPQEKACDGGCIPVAECCVRWGC